MDTKGNAALLKTARVTEWSLNIGGYIAIAFGAFILLGCIVAYFLATVRGNVDAILPLISDAAGSPPQNGLFGTLICLGGMFGAVFMIQRYLIIEEKSCEVNNLVTIVNKASLFIGILSLLGISLISGYPMNFHRNRDVWFMEVGLPHMIGGVMFFALGLVYMALQTILTFFLKTKSETFSVRVLFLLVCTAAFVYYMITVPEHLGSISHLYYSNNTEGEHNSTATMTYPATMGANLQIPIDTGGSYTSAAISEWVFVCFYCCFFFTFFNEAQEYSLVIVIETNAKKESEESNPNSRSQIISKPPPEARKVLRRDSTCQTMPDILESATTKVIKSELTRNAQQAAPKDIVANGTKETLSKTDEKLKRLISASSEDGETSCDGVTEEERRAIERIDVVVKNAEDTHKKNDESACTQTVQ